ncbi:hypothetical protein KKB40_06270 [Patescibacteria group bacterium]|nr:hypothetical protein [Patescibacteria group bacterium]
MTERQYRPFTHKLEKKSLIVYPVRDENPLTEVFDPQDNNSIQRHLEDLYQKHQESLNRGDYHILFVWNLEGSRMTDIWIHDMTNWSDSGPLIECVTFRDLEVCHDAGIASGDSVIVLGREEELRREVNNLQEYIDRERHVPNFPDGMTPTKSFYR